MHEIATKLGRFVNNMLKNMFLFLENMLNNIKSLVFSDKSHNFAAVLRNPKGKTL